MGTTQAAKSESAPASHQLAASNERRRRPQRAGALILLLSALAVVALAVVTLRFGVSRWIAASVQRGFNGEAFLDPLRERLAAVANATAARAPASSGDDASSAPGASPQGGRSG